WSRPLEAGGSLEQATAELSVLSRQYAMAHPGMIDSKPRATMQPRRLKDRLVANVRALLWMLFGAVGFVLLIGCAHVASLLLKFGITLDRLQETSGERRVDSLKELEENEAHGVALGGQAMAAGFGDFERQAFGAQLGQVVAQRGQAVLV